MKNRIDLKNFNIRTDLIIDEKIENKAFKKERINDNLQVTRIEVTKDLKNILNKKEGYYTTLEFEDITNFEDRQEIEKQLVIEIEKMMKKIGIDNQAECMVVGLGNKESTADALGPVVLEKVLVTRHLFLLNALVKDGIRCVSAISPGVMANTGMETSDIILSLISKIKPQFLLVIDALASSSIERINKTIQLTNTGIHPGSGIGNNRREISQDTIGIPVIAIGVPTVVESSILVNDTIDYLFKHLSYVKKHFDENKLIFSRNTKNYLQAIQNEDLTNQEKQEVIGILGTIDEEEKKKLIVEVLNSIGYNMIVTPKEIDFLVEKLSDTIANAINKALHKEVTD